MSDTAINSPNQSGFQQLSSLVAKRTAQQAEALAKNLRRQADAVQAIADQYEEKAQSLDVRANKAKSESDGMNARLTLGSAFEQGAAQLSQTMANATVKVDTYSPQGISGASIGKRSISGTHLDTTA